MAQKKYKNIARIASSKTGVGGWQVRIRHAGELHTRYFGDNACGGVTAALRQALAYRDEFLRTIGKSMLVDVEASYKSVSRIDQAHKRTHGWYVRVFFRGERRTRFFSDVQYGGKAEALAGALRYRDDMERELGKPRTDRVVVGRKARTNTGLLGVRRTTKIGRTRTGERTSSPVYEVTWSPAPNVLHRTSFSIEKYGEGEALRRARAFRREKEREVYGKVVSASAHSS